MTSVTSPSSAIVGQQIPVQATFKNQGVTDTLSTYTVGIYFCTSSVISTSCNRIGTSQNNTGAVGVEQTWNATVTVPPAYNGTYYIGAIVDYDNAIPESNDINNSLAGSPIMVN